MAIQLCLVIVSTVIGLGVFPLIFLTQTQLSDLMFMIYLYFSFFLFLFAKWYWLVPYFFEILNSKPLFIFIYSLDFYHLLVMYCMIFCFGYVYLP